VVTHSTSARIFSRSMRSQARSPKDKTPRSCKCAPEISTMDRCRC
jgi:hypothetical protein